MSLSRLLSVIKLICKSSGAGVILHGTCQSKDGQPVVSISICSLQPQLTEFEGNQMIRVKHMPIGRKMKTAPVLLGKHVFVDHLSANIRI